MAIFVDETTKVIVQGLTGGQGKYHGLRNRDYGTQVVGGVTPGKGGQDVDGIPIFNSVAEAVEATGANASFAAVPPKFASGAIMEAAAQTNMEQFLTLNDNNVDAVLSENDGMATGVVAALEAQGLAGVVPVSGQDGDVAALNRVALGTQSVSVWKDARVLGKVAGEAAVAMAQGTALADVADTIAYTSPGGVSMTANFLAPNPITRENLNVVLDAGVIDVATLCQNVPSGTVDVCP